MTIKKLIKRIPGVPMMQYQIQQRRAVKHWVSAGKPVPPPHIMKAHAVLEAAKTFGAKNLVETGTFLGHMIDMTKNYFDKIVSVELAPDLARDATRRFRSFKNVQVIEDDSAKAMPRILKELKGKTVFWLDAHYSGSITAKGAEYTPIAAEIKTIAGWNQPNTVILIDDARLFDGSDYPKLNDFISVARKLLPKHEVKVENDIIRITPR